MTKKKKKKKTVLWPFGNGLKWIKINKIISVKLKFENIIFSDYNNKKDFLSFSVDRY